MAAPGLMLAFGSLAASCGFSLEVTLLKKSHSIPWNCCVSPKCLHLFLFFNPHPRICFTDLRGAGGEKHQCKRETPHTHPDWDNAPTNWAPSPFLEDWFLTLAALKTYAGESTWFTAAAVQQPAWFFGFYYSLPVFWNAFFFLRRG